MTIKTKRITNPIQLKVVWEYRNGEPEFMGLVETTEPDDQNDGWIPTKTGKRPTSLDKVLLTIKSKTRFVVEGWWNGKYWFNHYGHVSPQSSILAWRPLPAPYRPRRAGR